MAMAAVFPGVCSESFCAESIEWKSRSRDSGVGAGTKLVLRSDSGGRRA